MVELRHIYRGIIVMKKFIYLLVSISLFLAQRPVNSRPLPDINLPFQDFSVQFGGDHQVFLNMGNGEFEWRAGSTGECVTLKGRPKISQVRYGFGLQYSQCKETDKLLQIWKIMVLEDYKNFKIQLKDTNYCVSTFYDMVPCNHRDVAMIALPFDLKRL